MFATALTIASSALWPGYLLDLGIAYLLGIAFQYFSIKPTSDLDVRSALGQAVKADTLSILAFELGMFGWMALVHWVLFVHPHLEADHAADWLMM